MCMRLDRQSAPKGAQKTESVSGELSFITNILLLLYQVLWFLAWVIVLFVHRFYIYHLYLTPQVWVVPLWIGEAATVGSLGGVVYAIHAICSGTTNQHRPANRLLWYLVKPVNGALVGASCGLLARLLLSVSGSAGIEQHILIAGVGFVAGTYEDFALSFIRRFADKRLGANL